MSDPQKALRHRDRRASALIFVAALGAAAGLGSFARASAKHAAPQFSAEEFLEPIRFLASDDLKGRGDGTQELDRAAEYIAQHFRRSGLRAAGDDSTFFQRFMMTVAATLGPKNSLVYQKGEGREEYAVERDFIPLSFSEDVSLEAPVVFAGYGITAPEYHYDDYQGIDANGKIVIVLRHEPQEFDEKSVFAGQQFTTHSEIVHKAINARNHGAAAMVLANDVGNHAGQPDELIRFGSLAGPEEMKLAAMQVKAAVADEWLKPSGQTLESLRSAIDKDLSNHSFALNPAARLSLKVDVERIRKKVANVVAVLPGRNQDECIVVGAHYDHLGLGDQHSLAPSQIGQIHHGADDNASGTSGLLELARGLSREKRKPPRSIVFAAFAGEEAGLLGSSFYVSHPALPLSQTLAMINLDMIGRISKNRLYVGGTGTSPGFRKLVEEANSPLGFELSFSASGYGASDHTSFTVRGVPVLFFFSGLHSDYHKPSDTWDKIDAVDGARVVGLVANVIQSLASLDERPQYVRVAEPAPSAMAGAGYGPYFGSVPDFGETEHGVKFADIRDGSPAAKAGFKAGDVLVQFGEQRIDNLYDFTYALRAHKPGDKVLVTVLRGGERITREVTLEVRR